jgi:hypothetical protein
MFRPLWETLAYIVGGVLLVVVALSVMSWALS